MTSLWVKIRDAIEHECATLQNLLAPLEAQLKPVAEQDLKDIAEAGLAAAAGAAVGEPLNLSTVEHVAIVSGRAVLAAAGTKGVALSEQAAIGVAALAGLTPAAK
jgi:N-acetylglutamate synthase-like GNAT family acetyltransferase